MKCTKSWNTLLAGLLLACVTVTVQAQNVTKLLVSPIMLRLETGGTGQITVEMQDEASRPIAPELVPVFFVSSDSTIVSVGVDGAVRAVKAGRAEIVVRAGTPARRVTVTVIVSPGAKPSVLSAPPVVTASAATPPTAPATAPATPPASPPVVPAASTGQTPVGATIQPINIQLLPGERFRPSFRLVYADGTQAETRDVVWNTFGAAIALDPNASEVIGVVPGSGTLGGRYGTSITNSVPVSVGEAVLLADPDSVFLVTGGMDTVSLLVPGQGRRKVTQNLTWRTTDPAVLRVLSPTAGIVQALDAGEATLIVDGYGVTRAIPVRVTPRIAKVETIPAQGSTLTVGTGGTTALEAKTIGTAGTVLSTSTLTWRIADPSIAQIDARGVVSGIREGATRVTLDVPGIETISWPLTVQAARVAFDLDVTAVVAGTTRKLVAQLRGADRRDYGTATGAQFTSSAPEIASVDATGAVTGIGPGRATISATQPGAGADSVTVYVTGRALVSGTIAGIRGLWQLVGANDTLPTLLARVDSGVVSQAVWSPDRTRIALTYEPLDRANQLRVVVIDADGRNWKNLSPDTISASDPSWAKDGKSILMAGRDPKVSSVLRVVVETREVTLLASGSSSKFRYPSADVDSSGILVRFESGGQTDLARIKAGTVTKLTDGKPREELIAQLRDGRVLLAVDSSSRSRPATLQWVTVGTDQVQTPTAVRVPARLVITDISAGYDDASVIIVARAQSWPGVSGPAVVVLRVALDGADPKLLMILNEKDFVTVRSD